MSVKFSACDISDIKINLLFTQFSYLLEAHEAIRRIRYVITEIYSVLSKNISAAYCLCKRYVALY